MPKQFKGVRALQLETLPYEPMAQFKPLAFSHGHWMGGVNSVGKTYARAWHRAQSSGRISVSMADELCVNVLHMHPAEVFGDLWFGSGG